MAAWRSTASPSRAGRWTWADFLFSGRLKFFGQTGLASRASLLVNAGMVLSSKMKPVACFRSWNLSTSEESVQELVQLDGVTGVTLVADLGCVPLFQVEAFPR